MPAYVITDVKVSDPQRYQAYTAISPQAVAEAGGRFLARGGRAQQLEGERTPGRVVVVEFPTYEAACAFYESALYRQARAARAGATERFEMVVVDGVPG